MAGCAVLFMFFSPALGVGKFLPFRRPFLHQVLWFGVDPPSPRKRLYRQLDGDEPILTAGYHYQRLFNTLIVPP